ncbi:acylphosphatase [Kushneria indalinina]|uniref:Acylphosphatase n=1 Tax=Kushneria indalinina DSM 14324 TaxID=1122140 RepID=A0A3D9DZN3_9GAMM|nr:acylphosphatase [Kushneria indalinina]REC96256.1 acylphosphatase [Kushneria indalinina DSM 14324]
MRYMQARVIGHVQGVGFRQATAQRARELDVVGYARNCDDGSVEVGMAGSDDNVTTLIDWLETGSPSSRVDQVTSEEIAPQQWSDFQTG